MAAVVRAVSAISEDTVIGLMGLCYCVMTVDG
jgi:hypothetical protein